MKNAMIFVTGLLIGAFVATGLSLAFDYVETPFEDQIGRVHKQFVEGYEIGYGRGVGDYLSDESVLQMEYTFAAGRQTTEEEILALLTQHMDTWSMIRPAPHWLEFAEQFGHAVAEGDYYDSYE